jgi:ubiquinone/menaquinone biosynthesis C-methylase UbiE
MESLCQGPRSQIDFAKDYDIRQTEVDIVVEREIYGANTGIHGYSTVAQADELARRLGLGPGVRLLDIGAGRGWPSLYLARTYGCEVVLTDQPVAALRDASERARREQLLHLSSFVRASGTRLPFPARVFDAITHTDAL